MLALLLRTIKNHRLSFTVFLVLNFVLLLMFVSLFPDIQDQSEELSQLVSNYPEEFIQAFGVRTEDIFSTFEGFLSAEHYSFMWPIITMIFAISLASSAIADEVEKGTIEILLTLPVSRTQIFIAKYLGGIALLLLYSIITVFLVLPLAALFDIETVFKPHLYVFIVGLLLAIATFSVSMFLSSISSARNRVLSLSAFLIIFMYAANLFASLQEKVEGLKYVSFFHYFDQTTLLLDEKIEPSSIVLYSGTTLVFFLLGLFTFRKRDIAV